MLEHIIVFIIISAAIGGLGRYIFLKIQFFKKNKDCADCDSCPLKKQCNKK